MSEETEYQRVMQLIKILDFDNLRQFVMKVDIPYSTLANGESKTGMVSSRVLSAIKRAFPSISLDWLVLGEGSPFLQPSAAAQQNIVNGDNSGHIAQTISADCTERLHQKDLEIADLRGQIKILKEMLPPRG